jgi:hypothetical protein
MTGRLKRMERAEGGGYKYVSRTAFFGGCSVDDVGGWCVLLLQYLLPAAFQQGRNRYTIITSAYSAHIYGDYQHAHF